MIRAKLIQYVNNIYRDEDEYDKEQSRYRELGELCCIGFYDAVRIKNIEWKSGENGIREKANELIINNMDQGCSIKNVICITKDCQKDDLFWEKAVEVPYLFLTTVRKNHKDKNPDHTVRNTIHELNKRNDVIAYYTYEHSELVVIKYAYTYGEGMNFILSIREHMSVYKMFSSFCIWENELKSSKRINDENIRCRLRGSAKDLQKIEIFISELEKYLCNQGEEEFEIRKYYTLGINDVLIEINDISIKALLPAYVTGGLLTHSNRLYREAFFNIETDFVINKAG